MKKYNLLHIPSGIYLYKYPVESFKFSIVSNEVSLQEQVKIIIKDFPFLVFEDWSEINYHFSSRESKIKVTIEEFDIIEYDE